jgi:hypothetical protein
VQLQTGSCHSEPANDEVAALVKGVNKWGIGPERFAGGHGSVGLYADVPQAVKTAPAGAR